MSAATMFWRLVLASGVSLLLLSGIYIFNHNVSAVDVITFGILSYLLARVVFE